MERTIKTFKQANAILMGDVHLREKENPPVCRTDDVWTAQWRKIDFISDLQQKHNCPVLCSGDLFHHWKPSPNLLTWASDHLPDQFHTIYGQHDLPQHNMDLAYKSGIWNLHKNRKLKIMEQCHFGQTPTNYWEVDPGNADEVLTFNTGIKTPLARAVLVWHVMNYQGKLPWPDCPSPLAAGILRKYPQYDLIVTGDNHKPFVETHEGRLLVNVGSMMRTTADQIDYKPAVWLWYAETNTVEKVYLPIEDGVISRDHIEVKEQRDDRINAFVERLNDEFEASMSFEENLEAFEKINNVRKSVMELIYKSLES